MISTNNSTNSHISSREALLSSSHTPITYKCQQSHARDRRSALHCRNKHTRTNKFGIKQPQCHSHHDLTSPYLHSQLQRQGTYTNTRTQTQTTTRDCECVCDTHANSARPRVPPASDRGPRDRNGEGRRERGDRERG